MTEARVKEIVGGDVDPEAMEQAVLALVRGTRRRTA